MKRKNKILCVLCCEQSSVHPEVDGEIVCPHLAGDGNEEGGEVDRDGYPIGGFDDLE